MMICERNIIDIVLSIDMLRLFCERKSRQEKAGAQNYIYVCHLFRRFLRVVEMLGEAVEN